MKNFQLAIIRKLGVLLAVVVLSLGLMFAKVPDKKDFGQNQPLRKTAGEPVMTILNINTFTSFMRADGQGNHDMTDRSGGRYPRGTSTCIYEDGFVWGGKLYIDAAKTQPSSQLIRVGGQTYNQGTRQGAVVGTGAGATRMMPSDARARIYRIRRDYKQMSSNEIRSDAATLNLALESAVTQSQMNEVTAQYDTDWTNWPVDLGAPYIERNGTPGYQPPPAFSETFITENLIAGNYDEPGIAGANPNSPADQVIWTVYNDLDESAVFELYQSAPIGLEGQVTMWAYKRTDAMGNLYFKKLKLINKGGVDVGGGTLGSFAGDSLYLAQWSDPDLGVSGDDLCGSDTTLSLGFAYNGNPVDLEYRKFNLPPPAVGYDFLQGPLVPAPGETAIFDLKRVPDKKNLPMTAFVYFSAGSPISDPLLTGQLDASYESTLMWYRMLRGLRPDASTIPERFYPFPPGTTPGPFALSGDPVKQTGFIDGLGYDYSLGPGDRRIVLASGPFNLNPGDTQDVVVGTVGGIGSDRLSSVAMMKFNDTFVQNTFDALFVVPNRPPPQPHLSGNDTTNVPVNPTLTWNSVPGAIAYRVQVSLSRDFIPTVSDSSGITDTTITIASLSYNTKYYCRVSAIFVDGGGAFSDPLGFTTEPTNSISAPVKIVPKEFTLHQNYPNPFNPVTTIEFSLEEDGKVVLKVFDILGHEVATLIDSDMKSGILYQIRFDASQLSTGLYLYRLESGKNVLVKKLLLMK